MALAHHYDYKRDLAQRLSVAASGDEHVFAAYFMCELFYRLFSSHLGLIEDRHARVELILRQCDLNTFLVCQ